MNTNDRTPEEQEFFDALTQGIGQIVLKSILIADRMGWKTLSGLRTYLHADSIPSAIFIDFGDWATGHATDEARDRLRTVALTWGLDDEVLAAAAAQHRGVTDP